MPKVSSHYCDGVKFDILSYFVASSGHGSVLQAEWRFVDTVATDGYTRYTPIRPFHNSTEPQ